MDSPSPSIRRLARQLLAIEAAAAARANAAPAQHEVVRVCEKLRISLIRFAGADAFTALLRRAMALARAEVPALSRIILKPETSLDGLEALANEAAGGEKAAIALISHLLALLVTFIGEPLMLRLVREAWPNISPVE